MCILGIVLMSGLSCSRAKTNQEEPDLAETIEYLSKTMELAEEPGSALNYREENHNMLASALHRAEIPENISRKILDASAKNPALIIELLSFRQSDPYLFRLVDKNHALPPDYAPEDLVQLGASAGLPAKSYYTGRAGLLLRSEAETALEEMAAAARADGVRLVVSSAYRSYSYQKQVYERNVAEMGREAADRESARPGYSQHQTGLVLDFGSIDDTFASSPAGLWLTAHASRFGWSLSYPDGFEHITGYRWESWHYRYLGKDLTAFIDRYFEGIQQFGLRFIDEWEKLDLFDNQ